MSNIFLIEDDQYISRVYERAFRLAGHQIDIKYDGESAWEALSTTQTPPEVILLDITLPKMNGVELLEKIHADKKLDHSPVVVLTNSFNEDLEKKLLTAGASLYLTKIDYKPKELVEKIETLLQKPK